MLRLTIVAVPALPTVNHTSSSNSRTLGGFGPDRRQVGLGIGRTLFDRFEIEPENGTVQLAAALTNR